MNKENKDHLLDLLNRMWSTIPEENRPTYREFNALMPVDEGKEGLRELESEHPEVGIARYGGEYEGVSVLSIIATITEVGFGDRLGVVLDGEPSDEEGADNVKISGFCWYQEL